jgi:hypothetical protein
MLASPIHDTMCHKESCCQVAMSIEYLIIAALDLSNVGDIESSSTQSQAGVSNQGAINTKTDRTRRLGQDMLAKRPLV